MPADQIPFCLETIPTTFPFASSSATRSNSYLVAQPFIGAPFAAEKLFDFFICIGRSEKAALHCIPGSRRATRLVLQFVPCGERRADGATGIAGRGLNP